MRWPEHAKSRKPLEKAPRGYDNGRAPDIIHAWAQSANHGAAMSKSSDIRKTKSFAGLKAASGEAWEEARLSLASKSPPKQANVFQKLGAMISEPVKSEAGVKLDAAVRMFIQSRKMLDGANWRGAAAVAIAICCKKDWAQGLASLLAAGASPLEICDGRSPMAHAASAGAIECMKILKKAGASVNGAVGIDTPFSNAGISEWIQDDSLGETPMIAAVSSKKLAAMEWLFAEGASLDRADARGLSPAHWAALTCSIGLESGEPALLWLSRKGARLDGVSKDGRTALLCAMAGKGAAGAINILGPSCRELVNHQCAGGDSAATLAAQSGDWDALVALMKLGANLSLKNKRGMTAMSLAENRGLLSALHSEKDRQELSAMLAGDIISTEATEKAAFRL